MTRILSESLRLNRASQAVRRENEISAESTRSIGAGHAGAAR
jgi:hypothetical protein